jgi:NAD(P)-dependent dehydrogenase (short-subunit alcohol dehydrogenase family)
MASYERFSLAGRTVLVAGASRGIGLAIAREVAAAGARTFLGARSLERLEEEAARLVNEGHQAEAVRLDVADRASVAEVVAGLPDLDGLVNVAGVNIRKRFEAYTDEEYEHILGTNLHAQVHLTRLVGTRMLARGSGKVVFIGSSNQLTSLPYLALYSMTKSAIGGLTRALAAEWGARGIQVNCIVPGLIWTDLTAHVWSDPAIAAWREGVQPIPRWGYPEDIAPLAVYLLGSASDFVTGQAIAVDGGYTTTKVWPLRP